MPALGGLSVLITRPQDQAEDTAAAVARLGGTALVHPCLALGPPLDAAALDRALGELPSCQVAAWTSANAVRAVAERLAGAGQKLDQALQGCYVAAMGERTAAALRQHDAHVDLVGYGLSAEGLAERILAELHGDVAGKRVFLPRAAEGREALGEVLQAAGAEVVPVVVYQMTPVPPARLLGAAQALRGGQVDLVPLGSPRTAAALLAALGPEGPRVLARATVGAIGQTTAAALRKAGVRVDVVAEEADFTGLILLLAEKRRGAEGGS